MENPRIYTMAFGKIYPAYVAKAERNGRTKAEVDEIIKWLTGYTTKQVEAIIEDGTDIETFYTEAPALHPARLSITGTVCGVRIEDIDEPTMRNIRILDKLIDDLAKVKTVEELMA